MADAVAVIGGAGFIGRAVVAELERRGAVPLVVDRVGAVPLDLLAPDAAPRLTELLRTARVRAVVHLAARVDPHAGATERAAARRLHVEGTRVALGAARQSGAARFVLASSATVYGAHPDNPVPLDESAPLRPNPYAYAEDKLAQEDVVAREGAGLSVAIARPAIVYGAGARSYLTEILTRAPVLPALDGCRPPLQFAHVADVAAALVELARCDAVGAFNVAPADWLSLDEVARLVDKRVLSVPSRLLAPLLDAGARLLPPHLRAPAAMVPYLKYPFVLSARKLEQTTGWRPRASSADALRTIL
ncbi:MAG: NAD-dependent epimerase/dehydratase family protein [Deltaproteobacteria bacterium]|nr:NAD-dependent epimerase/dehydratase family protein [Deltaproteobacteria bacterium]